MNEEMELFLEDMAAAVIATIYMEDEELGAYFARNVGNPDRNSWS